MDSLEKLLLLEILVDNVYYERTAIDPDLFAHLKDTNVRFQFFDYPPIDIGEVDFCQTGEGFVNSEVSFKSGKSVLFALPDVSSEVEQFDLLVEVSRKYATKKEPIKSEEGKDQKQEKPEIEWKSYEVGKTTIHLGDSFLNLLEATSYDGACPASRTVRDSYPFTSKKGDVVGFITVFVRLSCFGKIIITKFQADTLEDKSFCFKGGDDEGAPSTPAEWPQQGGGEAPPFMPPNFMSPQMMMPPNFMPPMMPQMIKVPVPLKSRPTVNKCGKVPSELLSSDSEGPYCLHQDCPQGFPRPPWVAGRRPGSSGHSVRGTPVGSAAFQGDNVLFQLQNPNNPSVTANKEDTVYRVNQEPGQALQNVQLVKPDFKPEMDDDHDVFLLKFGKNDGNKPAKIIVTMKTPKAPIIKEHKCTSEQICQTDTSLAKKPKELPSSLTTREVAAALGKGNMTPGKKTGKGNKKETGLDMYYSNE